jgi:hypothetical protein
MNYEDDVFTLALHVRCLHDSLKLDIDPDFFRKGVLAHIDWLDSVIGRMHQSLQSSSLFVRRQEILLSLHKLRRSFIRTLDDLIDKKVAFAQCLEGKEEQLRSIRDRQERENAEGKALVSGRGPGTEEEHIVSPEELKFLMTAPEDTG